MAGQSSIHRPHWIKPSGVIMSTVNAAENLVVAEESDDGFWRNTKGEPLHVSASDLERHTYCPLSWSLARDGKSGRGEAIQLGREKHAEIHSKIENFKIKQTELRRALVVWSWWFTIIILFIGDAVIFSSIDDLNLPPDEMARFLAVLASVWLFIAIIAIYLPWRSWIKLPTAEQKSKLDFEIDEEVVIPYTIQPMGFIGGWAEGGKIEAGLLMGSIICGLHAIGLIWAEDKQQAGFILIAMAMLWTLFASWQLQRALLADNALKIASEDAGIDRDTDIAYSDDESTAGLLVDEGTGLRGRPDQIVIVDGEFIPVEQKTGKIPENPHDSHKIQLLAYLHLVESTTGRTPPYGVLRYGEDNLHQIEWNDDAKHRLMSATKEVQRLMVEGGAERNHNRKGKCQSCSRKWACDSSLV